MSFFGIKPSSSDAPALIAGMTGSHGEDFAGLIQL